MSTHSAPLRTAGISAARDYKELPAWQKAIAMAEDVYAATEDFPAREHAGLALQMRQSAIKVAGHIAAASARLNDHGVSDSYSHAQSAAAELLTMLALAEKLGYVANAEAISTTLAEIERLLIGMKHALKVAAKDDDRKSREGAKLDREHSERNERKPRRDYGDRPNREGGPRGDRPYKSRDDRGGEREYKPRRDYGDKPNREGGPRGERKERPEYKSGERSEYKPRGEYKPKRDFGGKPKGDRPYKARDDRGGDRPPRKPHRKD